MGGNPLYPLSIKKKKKTLSQALDSAPEVSPEALGFEPRDVVGELEVRLCQAPDVAPDIEPVIVEAEDDIVSF